MTMDKHRNIFYSYNQGDFNDIEREIQLEDNVTKALINVLENSDRQIIVDFLKRFVNPKVRLGRTKFQYVLQKNLVEELNKTAKEAPHKFILGISPTGKMDEKSQTIVGLEREKEKLKGIKTQIKNILRNENEVEGSKIVDRFIKLLNANKIQFDSRKQDINVSDINYLYQLLASKSRPDGWIVNKNIAVLIENKIWGKLSSNQIDRHNKLFKGEGKFKPAPWKGIYNFFKGESSRNELDEVTKFLVKQFTEYLEVLELAGFTGIPFNDSIPHEPDRAKSILRNLMEKISSEVLDLDESLKRKGRPLADPWDWFGEESLHFTIILEGEEWAGLDLFVKNGRCLTKLRKNPSLIFEEIERLSSCSEDYWLDTQYWRQHDWKRGKQRGPMASFEGYFVKLARLMKRRDWREVVEFMRKISRYQKAFRIEKRFFYKSKKHQSLLQSPDFSKEIVKGIKELLPLYQELRTSEG